MKIRNGAFLVGPFIGELSWEYFQFAPYIIYLKKEHPDKKVIVFTRPSRFDLYGVYADILVPLKLPNWTKNHQRAFTIDSFDKEEYEFLAETYRKQYRSRFKIIEHIYPDISMFYYKLTWQFSRPLMDYDFKPRKHNGLIVDKYLCSYDILLDSKESCSYSNKHIKNIKDLAVEYEKMKDDTHSSTFGCIIESIKVCRYVISNISSNIGRMALLLKTPVITIDETLSDDQIHLFNPYNTPVIRASNIEEGIECYENNF